VLTARQTKLIQNSFRNVQQHGEVAALIFYQKLFALDPALRPLFTQDIKDQARKLMEMLAGAVALLDKPGELVPVLEALGARHVKYGVREAHYPTVGAALIAMLESVLAEKFTSETRAAWLALYEVIASTMLRGAASAVAQTGEA
jgi:hemoglobin-like flavoprotein